MGQTGQEDNVVLGNTQLHKHTALFMDAQVHLCVLLALSPQEVNKPHSLPQLSLCQGHRCTLWTKSSFAAFDSPGKKKKKSLTTMTKEIPLKPDASALARRAVTVEGL